MSNATAALKALKDMGSASLNDLSDDDLRQFVSLCLKWQEQGRRRLLHRRDIPSRHQTIFGEADTDSISFVSSFSQRG